jgi:CPA1 family monovalent cation:H+ antiporter
MTESAVLLLVGLLCVAIPVIALAQRASISYPIVLVVAGVVLGFIPGLPQATLDPNLVLVIFLPPLLYWESINAPTDAMRRHEGSIGTLVLGLVVVTTFVVALVAHATIAALPWAMAFVLGAIVAPTDELASAPVLDAMRMPRALVAIVEGESLLNDATSLILYAAAIATVVTGIFHLWATIGWFFFSALGGIAIGWIGAVVQRELWRRVRDSNLQLTLSVTMPYLAYLLAGRIGVSGVLAAVFLGAVSNRYSPVVVTPQARLQAQGFWNTTVFLANTILFLLVGLQLNGIGHRVLAEYPWWTILGYTVIVNVTVIVVRFAWFLGNEYVPGLPLVSGADSAPNWRRALVAAWSGLRGAVSLAAALAIPVTTLSGAPVPQRELIIFLTFSVIVVTLVGGGLTLPLVIARLHIPSSDDEDEAEIRTALAAMLSAATSYIDGMVQRGEITPDEATHLRMRSERRLRAHDADARRELTLDQERQVVEEERATLISLRNRGEIDNTILRKLQYKLDLADAALPPRETEEG